VIFGAYALSSASQAEADRVLELLLAYGINHIDTAATYGDAELRIGPWMENHRDAFFLATKTRSRRRRGAWDDLRRSLERLRTDHIDLWQMHALTGAVGWETAMAPGGALEAFLEAREKGLVRFLGVTGHGVDAPAMHLRSLDRYSFDSVLAPYNYPMMSKPRYAASFEALQARCREQGAALQVIKTLARQPAKPGTGRYHTFFYEPLDTQGAIDRAVHWAMGNPDAFVVSAGDMTVLPMMLEAAARFLRRPSEEEMAALVAEQGMRPVFA
jgi:aryl-alcohol dehydrogenase-like predicted oxidoreductase